MSDSTNLIGIEIGGTKLQAALGTPTGVVRQMLRVEADAAGGASAILIQLEQLVRELQVAEEVSGIGIGFGGPVDAARGTVITSHHVAGWENCSLSDWSQLQFGLPCVVGNDTDTAALAEATLGAGRGEPCVFYTNIGSGIGGGFVVEGRLYERPAGAMEIGHTRVYSTLDNCWGIVEDFCSGWSLGRRARRLAQAHPDSCMWQIAAHRDTIDCKTLFEAWLQHDEPATRLVDDFLCCYTTAVANVIALLNPSIVVIGGGVARVGQPLLSAIRSGVQKTVYQPFANSYRIEPSALGDRSVPAGALLMAGRLLPLGSNRPGTVGDSHLD